MRFAGIVKNVFLVFDSHQNILWHYLFLRGFKVELVRKVVFKGLKRVGWPLNHLLRLMFETFRVFLRVQCSIRLVLSDTFYQYLMRMSATRLIVFAVDALAFACALDVLFITLAVLLLALALCAFAALSVLLILDFVVESFGVRPDDIFNCFFAHVLEISFVSAIVILVALTRRAAKGVFFEAYTIVFKALIVFTPATFASWVRLKKFLLSLGLI